MRKLNQVALAAAARAFCTAHYAKRFNKDPADPHVSMNVTYNWQDHVADAEIYVRAYLAAYGPEVARLREMTPAEAAEFAGRLAVASAAGPAMDIVPCPDRHPTKEACTLASEYFGTDRDTWNHETDGKPGVDLFANAVQVWAIQNANASRAPVTVAAAAAAFAVPPQMIVEAVEHHYWMYLEGPHDDFGKLRIEHEGE